MVFSSFEISETLSVLDSIVFYLKNERENKVYTL